MNDGELFSRKKVSGSRTKYIINVIYDIIVQ